MYGGRSGSRKTTVIVQMSDDNLEVEVDIEIKLNN